MGEWFSLCVIKMVPGLQATLVAVEHTGIPMFGFFSPQPQGVNALSYPLGGFPSIRHNEIRDLTGNLVAEVCRNVSIEPHLQPITGETFSANTEDGARSDIAAGGLWGGRFKRTFFDVTVFPSLCPFQPHSHTL